MEHSPPRAANSCSATTETYPTVHYGVRYRLPTATKLTQMNQLHAPTPVFKVRV